MSRGGQSSGRQERKWHEPWKAPEIVHSEVSDKPLPLSMSGKDALFALELMISMKNIFDGQPVFVNFDAERIKTVIAVKLGDVTSIQELGRSLTNQEGGANALFGEIMHAHSRRSQGRFRSQDKVDFWSVVSKGYFIDDENTVRNPLYFLIQAVANGRITIYDVRKEG